MKIVYFFLIIFSFYSFLHPTPRYVKTGNPNPVPPYLSWATAADSIQKCINIANIGDTIYVGKGVYKEMVRPKKNMVLIGSGNDSCIVDIQDFTISPYPYPANRPTAFYLSDSNTVMHFGIIANKINLYPSEYQNRDVLAHFDVVNYACLKYNRLIRGMGILLPAGEVTGNVLEYGAALVFGMNDRFAGTIVVDSNIVKRCDRPPVETRGPTVVMRHNIIRVPLNELGFDGFGGSNHIIRNNIFYSFEYNEFPNDAAIYAWSPTIENNAILSGHTYSIIASGVSVIRNNILDSCEYALRIGNNISTTFTYNNLNKTRTRYWGFTNPADSTNMDVNPMFVRDKGKGYPNYDYGDVHLEKFSPMIDAGDPEILDKDGTRSDIGAYGGPLGEIYSYQDMPPRPVFGLTLVSDTIAGTLILRWRKNTETDVGGYEVYRDTVSNFSADSTRLIRQQQDTLYVCPRGRGSVYFKVRAYDNQGNRSETGTQVGIAVTGIREENTRIETYKLYQNYPNPFNPDTKIAYSIARPGYVKIIVTDILGKTVQYLVNGEREPGYYEEVFTPVVRDKEFDTVHRLVSGIYFYRMEVIDREKGIITYYETKKMVYQK